MFIWEPRSTRAPAHDRPSITGPAPLARPSLARGTSFALPPSALATALGSTTPSLCHPSSTQPTSSAT
eukprot:2559188-Lingulodinium_polyedra.AAC.1